MALTVEDGTGLAGADSFISLAAFKTACANLGYVLTAYTDPQLEVSLRKGFDYINTAWRYKGTRLTAAQAGEFPRTDLVDWSGFTVTDVPARVVKANVELGFKGLTVDLYTDLDRGGRVQSESVGPISVTYAADAPAGVVFRAAEQLLLPYIRKAGDTMNPVYYDTDAAEADPLFDKGMMDNPGDGSFNDTTE
jgi:hypothetical protein